MTESLSSPCVSVIIPTYNREDFIAEALESVIRQTYKNIELIIVDDGSTDNTEAIVRKYRSKNCFYYSLAHEGNISKLRNFGLQRATGVFIAYLDADDRWDKDKLQKQVELLKANADKGLVFTDVVEFKDQKIIRNGIYTQPLKGEILFKEILGNKLPIYPSTILYRKSGLHGMDFHDESFLWNDLGFITRFIAKNGAVICRQTLTHIRKHDQNISTLKRNEAVGFRDMIKTTEILYAQKLLTRNEYVQMSARFYTDMGAMFRHLREYKDARQAYTKALSLKPYALKTIAACFLVTIKRALV